MGMNSIPNDSMQGTRGASGDEPHVYNQLTLLKSFISEQAWLLNQAKPLFPDLGGGAGIEFVTVPETVPALAVLLFPFVFKKHR
jgi:hypothetical protein